MKEFNLWTEEIYRPMRRAWHSKGLPGMIETLLIRDGDGVSVGHKIVFSQLLPAYFLGAILRGRFLRPDEPDDWNQLMNDVFVFGMMKVVPVFGPAMAAKMIYGRYIESSTPYLELVNDINDTALNAFKAMEDGDKEKLKEAGINSISLWNYAGAPRMLTNTVRKYAAGALQEYDAPVPEFLKQDVMRWKPEE